MKTITKRQQHLLQILIDTNNFSPTKNTYITSHELSIQLSVSSRTVRTEIRNLLEIIKDFAYINVTSGQGYQLIVSNNNLFNDFIQSLPIYHTPTNTLERAHYILNLMLKKQQFIKIETIAQMLYIDRTAVSRSLSYIRDWIESFGLELEQKKGKGLKIIGDEFSYRQCMAQYLYHESANLTTKISTNQKFIKELQKVVFDDGIIMPKRVFTNFIIHIQVQLDRIKDNKFIHFNQEEHNKFTKEYEYLVAKDITKLIKKHFKINLPLDEQSYLMIHIIGKKSNSTSTIESCLNNQLKPEINQVVQKMFDRISERFDIDFSNDDYLRKSLGVHINPMEKRLKFNTYLRNPIINDIKIKYPLAYILSIEAWLAIHQYSNYTNIDDELGYIAIHFQYALERRKRHNSKKRALLVNDYNVALGELISFSILNNFPDLLVIEQSISANDLSNYDLNNYDLLITTVNIESRLKLPIIKIDPTVNEFDLSKLNHFLQTKTNYTLNDFKSKITFISLFIDNKNDFLKFINKDKKTDFLCNFSMDNHLSLFYSINKTKESEIIFYNLSKPILWQNKLIKIFIFLKLGNDYEIILDCIQFLLSKAQSDNFLLSIDEKELKNYIYSSPTNNNFTYKIN